MVQSKNCIQEIVPLTFLQKCMLIKFLKDSVSDCYFEQCHYILEGYVQKNLVEESWMKVIEAHDTLRGKIVWEKVREPIFVIYTKYLSTIKVQDVRHIKGKKDYIRKLKDYNWTNKVKLNSAPFHLTLLWTQNSELHVIVDTHHSIIDGWSNALILKQFFLVYNALCQKRELLLPVYQLKDVIYQNSIGKREASNFWKKYLADYYLDQKHTGAGSDIREYYRMSFSDDLYDKISKFIAIKNLLFSSVFYGAWALLKKEELNKSDHVFGVTFSGRKARVKHMEEAVGVFINTVPLRVNTDSSEDVLLKQINSDLIAISSIQHVSFLELSAEIGIKINGIFDTTIVIQNYPIDSRLQSSNDLPSRLSLVSTKYSPPAHLTIGFLDVNKKLLEFFYNPEHYNKHEIVNISHNYVRMITKIVS
jgi:hypothetical protein